MTEWADASNELQVFPNPATGGDVRLQSNSAIQSLKIYSMSGQLVYSDFGIGPIIFFDSDLLASGIYTVMITNQMGLFTAARFVKTSH